MGFFDKLSSGFNSITSKVGNFLNDHPMIDNAVSTGLGFIPGGGAINTALDMTQSMANAAQNDGSVKPSKVLETLQVSGASPTGGMFGNLLKTIQQKAGVPINTSTKEVMKLASSPMATAVVRKATLDSATPTTTGNNNANNTNDGWFRKQWNKLKQFWDGLESWQKIALPITTVVVLLVFLGYTLFSSKKRGKRVFFGRFRK